MCARQCVERPPVDCNKAARGIIEVAAGTQPRAAEKREFGALLSGTRAGPAVSGIE
jgi:hypothetical protein